MQFKPTRAEGLARLATFTQYAGKAYQERRNFDIDASQVSAVSQLSPWLRHRLISEQEVLTSARNQHSLEAAIPYVQQVFWRGYFKGWLEQHPTVWQSYKSQLAKAQQNLSVGYAEAAAGQTGILCFDHWCHALKNDGYMHNHARLWFASIWIFTLKLPWELGAAFFLEHLHDGDPASNTLSWRWVAGLHTKGKNYVASADNIEKFTDGRFRPTGQLAQAPAPLVENEEHLFVPFEPAQNEPNKPHLLVITEEDCLSSFEVDPRFSGVLGLVSPDASHFAKTAVQNTVSKLGGDTYVGHHWSKEITLAAQNAQTSKVITPYIPVGHVSDGMAVAANTLKGHGIDLTMSTRAYDIQVWPNATKGFFKLKKKIPSILEALNIG
jgi:deoxyribodipyrimidine photo-lyase